MPAKWNEDAIEADIEGNAGMMLLEFSKDDMLIFSNKLCMRKG